MGQGIGLVAFDERRVLINRGDRQRLARRLILAGHLAHQPRLHGLELFDPVAGRQDETLLLAAGRPALGQALIVKALEEIPNGARLGQGEAQAPLQAGVVLQEDDVFGTVAAGDLEQQQGFDPLAFLQAAAAGLEPEVGLDLGRELEAAQGAGGAQQADAGAGHLAQGPGINAEGAFGLEGQTRGHARV